MLKKLSIGNSPIAPKFNIISNPNEWSKTVKTTASKGELSKTKKLQLEYWTKFREFMEENNSFVKGARLFTAEHSNRQFIKTVIKMIF